MFGRRYAYSLYFAYWLFSLNSQKGEPFQVITGVSDFYRGVYTMVPSSVEALMAVLHNELYIYVLHPQDRLQWHLQTTSLAIEVISGSQIFIRSHDLETKDCFGLEDELKLFENGYSGGHQGDRAGPAKFIPLSSAVHQRPSTASSSQKPVQQSSVQRKATKFPLAYVCDMLPSLYRLQGLREGTRAAEFSKQFPACTYKHSTVGAAFTVLRRAMEHSLVDEYISYGRTPKGMWKTLAKAILGMCLHLYHSNLSDILR